MKFIASVLLFVLFATTVFASETILPNAPKPSKKPITAFSFALASTIIDTELTNVTIHGGCREYNPLSPRYPTRLEMYGTQLPLLVLLTWFTMHKHRKPWALYTFGALHSAGIVFTLAKSQDCF